MTGQSDDGYTSSDDMIYRRAFRDGCVVALEDLAVMLEEEATGQDGGFYDGLIHAAQLARRVKP